MEFRRVRPDEGPQLRTFRLRALRDAPFAFASTVEAEEALPLPVWEEAAARRAVSDSDATFVAVEDGQWAGVVGGFRRAGNEEAIELVSMWTAPEFRGRGAARGLVEEVVSWASSVGAAAVELWVTRGNDPAIRLYEGAGFVPTGHHQPLPSDPCKDELRMRRLLAGAAPERPTGR